MLNTLPSSGPVPGSAALVRQRDDDDAILSFPVNKIERIAGQDKSSRAVTELRAKFCVLAKQLDDALDFIAKIRRYCLAGLEMVLIDRVIKLDFSLYIPDNFRSRFLCSLASSFAKTSSCRIKVAVSASISATRRAISSSQALAMASGEPSGSPSRLTIRLWINSLRSRGAVARLGFQSLSKFPP